MRKRLEIKLGPPPYAERMCPGCLRQMRAGRRRGGMPLMTIDHIRPRCLNGPDTAENFRLVCLPCNVELINVDQCIGALAMRIALYSLREDRHGQRARREWAGSPLLTGRTS